jgi:hypothetical protein
MAEAGAGPGLPRYEFNYTYFQEVGRLNGHGIAPRPWTFIPLPDKKKQTKIQFNMYINTSIC